MCPRALGVGYDTIGALLNETLAARAILVLVIVKATIWAVSLGSGTSGGVLAPLLMMGGALGGIESHFFPNEGVGFWPLVSMGAILGGTMRSPLTGIVFAVELTHDMNMFLPLVIAVTVAHAFTVLVLRRSILTEKVARRGFHVTREYSIDALDMLFVRDVMNETPVLLRAAGTLGEALGLVDDTRHDDKAQHLFPLLDDDAKLVGAITRAEIAAWAREPSNHARALDRFEHGKHLVVASNQTLRVAAHMMAEANVTRLLVVNPADASRLVGKLALHDLLKGRVRNLEEERRRERILPWEYILPRWLRTSGRVVGSGVVGRRDAKV